MKSFKVTRGEKRGTLNVQCASRDCGFKFVVRRSWAEGWISPEGRLHATAPCPNCFKTFERRLP